jgi:cysteinyl-tRNA synthetase
MKLYSTLDRKIVNIVPNKEGQISMYNCGPTVYFRMHIGNIRAYINWDVLHRAFLYLGYDVKRVMNITDVGHMTSLDDFGDDFGDEKFDIQAQREGREPLDIANKYIDTVLNDFKSLNILSPSGKSISSNLTYENIQDYGWSRATEYIKEMIEMIKRIEDNGYTYKTKQALYFDVSKLENYTIFTKQKLCEKEVGVREEVGVDDQKRNPADFVLWMKKVGKYKDHIMNWDSPWGEGFPGWHIECSAMGTTILGEYFDIHTGGVDHIPVHHTNERAQNIGAFNHPVVKYWIHNEWLVNKDNSKLSKSKNSAPTLPEIVDMGFSPMDVRYFFCSINYRTKIEFSFEVLRGARNSRLSLLKRIRELGTKEGKPIEKYLERLKRELQNNLNMSGVFGLVNELLKSKYSQEDILATIYDFDKVLGLNLERENREEKIDSEVEKLLKERETFRGKKDFEASDRLRVLILQKGYIVKDTSKGQILERKYD